MWLKLIHNRKQNLPQNTELNIYLQSIASTIMIWVCVKRSLWQTHKHSHQIFILRLRWNLMSMHTRLHTYAVNSQRQRCEECPSGIKWFNDKNAGLKTCLGNTANIAANPKTSNNSSLTLKRNKKSLDGSGNGNTIEIQQKCKIRYVTLTLGLPQLLHQKEQLWLLSQEHALIDYDWVPLQNSFPEERYIHEWQINSCLTTLPSRHSILDHDC